MNREPLDAGRIFAPEQRRVAIMLEAQARKFGAKTLIETGAGRWSFAETPELAARAAGRLQRAGIQAGDRVALMCQNRPEFIEVFLGCAWLGASLVPINVASRGLQLRHILENSGARLMVIEAALLDALGCVDLSTLPLEAIWLIDHPGDGTRSQAIAQPLPPLEAPIPAGATRPGDTLAILYTSGTTGPSKGVCCPHAQFFWWGVNTAALLGVTDDDVLCTSLPLFHTNAINTFYQALLTGACVRYEKRFSASGFFPALAQHRASVTYLLGAMVPILLSRPESAEERAHATRIALAPGVPAQFHAPFTRRTGIRLIDGWGSTETNFVLGTTVERQKPGLMGPVSEGFAARAVGDQENEGADGVAC